jgi:hypothetical protein
MSKPTASITVPGLPATCPECGHVADAWPLATFGSRVGAACPACHVIVADLVAAGKGVQP